MRSLQLVEDTADLRKERGAFFTPPLLAAAAVEWALRSRDDLVLEPSCGDAAFLLPAVERLKALGAQSPRVFGVEIHGPSCIRARTRIADAGGMPDVAEGDFFRYSNLRSFDAVIGNPPYIRYQLFAGESRENAQRLCRLQGVEIGGLASSWAPFVVHASSMLRPGGRLALVLPSEFLMANYAEPVRTFLLRRFARVQIVMFRQRLFAGALEEVVLLLAEGDGGSDAFQVRELLDESALEAIKEPGGWSRLEARERWGASFDPVAASVLAKVVQTGRFGELSSWGRLELGAVSGNNNFFALSSAECEALKLESSDVKPLCPPGSRHLRGVEFSKGSWRDLGRAGLKTFLFHPNEDEMSTGARKYIASGSRLGVDQGFKCRNRNPWWKVPLAKKADLFFTYMNHEAPRLVVNSAGALHLNSLHGVVLDARARGVDRRALALGFLNSATLFGAEVIGRSYGGGILKLEPKEARRLPVPNVDVLAECADDLVRLSADLGVPLRAGDIASVVKAVDQVVLRKGLQLSRGDVAELSRGRVALFERRRERGGK